MGQAVSNILGTPSKLWADLMISGVHVVNPVANELHRGVDEFRRTADEFQRTADEFRRTLHTDFMIVVFIATLAIAMGFALKLFEIRRKYPPRSTPAVS